MAAAEFAGVWDFDTPTTIADPGVGKLRVAATDDRVAIAAVDRDGGDHHADLAAMEVLSTLRCQQRNDATLAVRYQLTGAAIDHTTWIEAPVTIVAESAGITGPPTKNADVMVVGTAPFAPPVYAGLPDPIIDPAIVADVVPGTTPEQAMLCAQLATLAVQTAIWPTAVPDPVPLPIMSATLSIACRLAVAGTGGESAAEGRVVSESIGSYSYRLADVPGIGDGLALTDVERRLLAPWMSASTVYELNTGTAIALPWDWFQHDLDRPDDTAAAVAS